MRRRAGFSFTTFNRVQKRVETFLYTCKDSLLASAFRMKFITATLITLISLGSALPAPGKLASRQETVKGFDISGWQDSVDFVGAYNAGLRFVMIKATEGTSFIDSTVSAKLILAHILNGIS